MRNRVLLCIPIVYTAVFAVISFSQEITPVKHEYLNGNCALNIPFQIVGGHIVVEGKINDSRDLRFTIDTGIPFKGIDILHQSVAREFIRGNVKVKFSLSGIDFYNQALRSIAGEHSAGIPEDGIIGLTLFSTCVVEIDFERSIINLYHPDIFLPDSMSVVYDIAFSGGPPIPKIEATISINGEKEITGLFSVDLGSANKISILPGSVHPILFPDEGNEKVIGRTSAGEIMGKISEIRSVRLGGKLIENVECAFFSERIFGRFNNNIIGMLGVDILKDFKITFNYSTEKMYFTHIDRE